jgi:hypothetical protein
MLGTIAVHQHINIRSKKKTRHAGSIEKWCNKKTFSLTNKVQRGVGLGK